jgi:hypothetical protein
LLTSLFFSFGILTAYRVLMVWVNDRIQSLLLVWLMHVALTASNVILGPLVTPGVTGPIWSLVKAAALWVVVALVVKANRAQFLGQSVPRQVGFGPSPKSPCI